LKQEIGAHAAAEEQTFYATLIAAPEGQPKARHSVHEHKTAADLLDELAELDFGSGGWLRKFRKLKEELEHHMDEEEREVFKRARKIISATRAEELSGTFRRRKSSELQ
jgi:hemerythrin-like domain-containing protein